MSLFNIDETAITEHVNKLVDAAVKAEMAKIRNQRPIVIKQPKPKKDIKIEGRYHSAFPNVLRAVQAGVVTALIGQTGSGKTYLAEQVANALGLDFYFDGTTNQEHKLLGYTLPSGEFVHMPFYEAFTKGGLYLADEKDSWNPNVSLCLNAPMSNRMAVFPNSPKPVKAHEEFRMMGTFNTWGKGSTRDYVGRNALDGATMARYIAQFEVNYDEDLERDISPNADWTDRVIEIRHAVEELGIRHIIHPRMSIGGAELLAGGMTQKDVEQCVIWKDLKASDIKKIGVEIARQKKEAIEGEIV